MSKLRSYFGYAVIVLAGLGAGLIVPKIPKYFQKPYTEGDYSRYYRSSAVKVVLYGTESCGFCKKTRDFLKNKNVAFSDLDVQKSEQARIEHNELGGGGVPVILVGNRRIQGFKPSALEDALEDIN